MDDFGTFQQHQTADDKVVASSFAIFSSRFGVSLTMLL